MPGNKVVSAQVSAALAERLRRHAAADDRTVSYALRKLLEEALNDERRPAEGAAVQESGRQARHEPE